jgi:KDO2-lipid IV(A) lauroyltransferase
MHRARIDKMSAAVPMDDLRGLIRALKAGHIIWYAPDQGKKTKFSSILPFFGEPAITNTATGRLAAMTDAAVIPFFGERHADGSYTLRILPALTDFPTVDADADALKITALMEQYIRLAPEQYFWIHRRFKRRGPSYQNVYPSKPKRRKNR